MSEGTVTAETAERSVRARLRLGEPIPAMPMSFDDVDPARPWRRAVPLDRLREQQRADRDAALEAERLLRERLDWAAFVPSEHEPDPGTEQEREPAAAPEPPAPERDLTELRAQIAAQRWKDAEATALRLAAEGRLDRLPDAAGYSTWSDERIAALRRSLDDLAEELDDVDDADYDEDDDLLDVHPLNWATEEVDAAQRALREAESHQVQAALSAWRVAEATVTGTSDAAMNGPFFNSVMMGLASSLQVAETTASALVHGAADLERKTPLSWARFLRGEVPWRGMQMLHAQLDGLDEEFWATFDEKASAALVTVAMPKLKDRLHTIRERVQARTAVDRLTRALKRMSVTIEPAADGMVLITALVPAPEGVAIDQRLDLAARAAANVEGEERSITELRAHVFLDVFDEGLFRGATPGLDGLAVPTRKGVQCKVGLLVPLMTVLGRSDVPAELDGYGPIDIDTAKRLLGESGSFLRVLTDEADGTVLDIGRKRYRPTAEMRTFLGILDHGGRGPNTGPPPSRTQADHVIPFNQRLARGRTALNNLVLLAARDHRVKTSGLWDIVLRARRDLAWTSFYGTRIITTVEPLEPTPVPDEFRRPAAAPAEPDGWPETNDDGSDVSF